MGENVTCEADWGAKFRESDVVVASDRNALDRTSSKRDVDVGVALPSTEKKNEGPIKRNELYTRSYTKASP